MAERIILFSKAECGLAGWKPVSRMTMTLSGKSLPSVDAVKMKGHRVGHALMGFQPTLLWPPCAAFIFTRTINIFNSQTLPRPML